MCKKKRLKQTKKKSYLIFLQIYIISTDPWCNLNYINCNIFLFDGGSHNNKQKPAPPLSSFWCFALGKKKKYVTELDDCKMGFYSMSPQAFDSVCVQEVRLLCIIRVSSVHWRVARLSYLISRFICKKKIAFYPRKQRQENSSKFDHWRSQCVRAPFFNNPDIQFYTKPHTIRRLHHTHHTSFVPIRSKHPPKHTQFNVLCNLYKLSFFLCLI